MPRSELSDGGGSGRADGTGFLPDGLSPRDLYAELKVVASSLLSRERNARTLQATALVHEVLVRLARSRSDSARAVWSTPQEFIRLAVVAMQHVLADHARRKRAQKRGGGVAPAAQDVLSLPAVSTDHGPDALAVCEAIDALGAVDPRSAEIVRLRFFAALSIPEVALVLGVNETAVRMEWRFARAWLARELRARGVDFANGAA